MTTETIEATTTEAEVTEPKARRAHRRTRPLEGQEPAAAVQAPPPALSEPPAPLLSAAGSRRANEVRRLELEIERADANTAATVLRMRCNCAPAAEILRVEGQMNQARDERSARLAYVETLTGRELALAYVPENTGWAG